MSASAEMFTLLLVTVLLLIHISGNLLRIKKKMDFTRMVKAHCMEQMEDKNHDLTEESLIFEHMAHCIFDKESNSDTLNDPDVVRYGELYRLYKKQGYYVLLYFVYKEEEEAIRENLEVSELTEREKDKFIAAHKVNVKDSVSKELEEDRNKLIHYWHRLPCYNKKKEK